MTEGNGKAYDVAVIGAGVSGLSAAAYMAKKGHSVVLFEKLKQLGGYVHTFRRGEFRFEASTHQYCLHPRYGNEVIAMLGAIKTSHIKSNTLYESILFDPSRGAITLRRTMPVGYATIVDTLRKMYPDSREGIDRYSRYLRRCGEEAITFKRAARNPAACLPDAILALMLKNGKGIIRKIGMLRFPGAVAYGKKSYGEISGPMLGNKELQWLLSAYTAYAGCAAHEVNAFTMASLNYLYFTDGPYLARGGTSELIAELAEIIGAHGGVIHKNAAVRNIVIENGRAIGVETADGAQHRAKTILSAVNTNDTFGCLVAEGHVPAEYREKISAVTHTLSAFQIYLGLPFNPRDYGFAAPSTFFDPTMDDSERFRLWEESLTPESRGATPFIMSNYAESDLSLAPPGKASVVLIEMCPMDDWDKLDQKEYAAKKAAFQETILKKVEALTGMPLREKAVVIVSGTPRTMKHYSSAPGGAILGASMSVGQCLGQRTQPVTPVRNLFLTGSYVSYPGVFSCLDAGIASANMVLKALKKG